MKLKKVLCLISILLLTGCNINYNIEIADDLSCKENIEISEKKSAFQENAIEDWNKIKSEYSYSEVINGENIIAYLLKNTNNIKDLINSDYVKRYVGDVTIKEGNTLSVRILFKQSFIDNLKGTFFRANTVDDIKLKIKIPYEVVKANNTTKEGDDAYVWIINNDSDLKMIKFEFKNPNKAKVYLKSIILPLIIFLIVQGIIVYVYLKSKKK